MCGREIDSPARAGIWPLPQVGIQPLPRVLSGDIVVLVSANQSHQVPIATVPGKLVWITHALGRNLAKVAGTSWREVICGPVCKTTIGTWSACKATVGGFLAGGYLWSAYKTAIAWTTRNPLTLQRSHGLKDSSCTTFG